MQSSFDRALAAVLKHEGCYVNHPKDPGGPTNKGVTLATFRKYVKPGGTAEDLKALTTAQAGTVYRRQYWDAVSGAVLPPGLDYAIFDFGVNSGPSRAIKMLQGIVNVEQDGAVGPKTLGNISVTDLAPLINSLCDQRLAWLKRLKTWPTFGKGWTSRVEGVRKLALQLAAEGGTAEPIPDTPAPPQPTHDVKGWEIDWSRVLMILAGAGLVVWALIVTLT